MDGQTGSIFFWEVVEIPHEVSRYVPRRISCGIATDAQSAKPPKIERILEQSQLSRGLLLAIRSN